jgi:hypothetical protein
MMNERKTIEQYLPRTGRGLGMLWTPPVEQVDERIKVQTPSRIDIEIESGRIQMNKASDLEWEMWMNPNAHPSVYRVDFHSPSVLKYSRFRK